MIEKNRGKIRISFFFLCRFGDHYEWNKVVTCIHNVLSQQRYLEHYGEVTIRNLKSNACTCRITFVKVNQPPSCFGWAILPFVLGLAWSVSALLKSRYWGSDANKNEVQGTVLDQSGNVIHSFGGLWHEGIFCDTLPTPKCIWKPSESLISADARHRQSVPQRGAWLFRHPTDPQPKDYLLYYGFSTFAMELNELTPDLKPLLPPTDSRLRPDQR